MNKHILMGITAAVLLLVGAGCAKSAPPAAPAQPEAAAPAPAAEEKKEEPAAAGEVRIDLRKDDTSARPKASAGVEAKPASQPNQQASQPQPSSSLSQNTDADQAQQPAPSVPTTKSFTITATQWSFSPNTITVKQGDTVRLRVTSLDVPHGILIDGYNINKVLNPNETVMFEFVADKKGTFNFRCSVQCGAGHPTMTGRLIVE